MSTTRSTEERISQWLEEVAVGQLPDRVLDATFETTRGLRQSRASAWRPFTMSRPIPAMVAVGAAAIIVIASVIYFRPSPTSNVGGSPPSPSPSPTMSPPSDGRTFTSAPGWTTYTSSRYHIDVSHPDDWAVDPADRAWDLDTDAPDWLSPAMDDFTAPTGDVRISIWSVPLDPGVIVEQSPEEVEAWIEAYCQKTGSTTCAGVLDQTVKLCVEVRDCHPGVLVASADREVQAFFTGGIYDGVMVVVTVWRGEHDSALTPYGGGRRLIESFLAPMCVWPEDARPEPPPGCLNVG